MKILKKILPENFKRKVKEELGVPSLHWSLENIKRMGFIPSFVIDGGAYEGYWTKDFSEVFPDAQVLMLEAQAGKEKYLKAICDENKRFHYHIGLLSDEDGKELAFMENETASHVIADRDGTGIRLIRSESLDAIIERRQFPYPDFIKLDLQGFELEVLKGSEKCIANTEFCLLEVSLLDLGGTPLMLEVMNYMHEKGFQAYDICQFMRRPYDQALYQIDLLFIKKTSLLIAQKRWD